MTAAANRHRRPGFALIMTLLVVVLLAVTTSQLATTTSVHALAVARQVHTPQHESAVDGAVRIAARLVTEDRSVVRALDRAGVHVFSFSLGECEVRCEVRDDGAKLDVAAFDADGRERLLKRKLRELGRRLGLPEARITLRPLPLNDMTVTKQYVWFDQLFGDLRGGELFRWTNDSKRPVWSDVLTCFGTGRVDVRRASRSVLTVLLSDLDRSLSRKLYAARRDPSRVESVLRSLDADLRRDVERRIAYGIDRYALSIDTAIRGDRRRWYVVITAGDGAVTLRHRGRVTW